MTSAASSPEVFSVALRTITFRDTENLSATVHHVAHMVLPWDPRRVHSTFIKLHGNTNNRSNNDQGNGASKGTGRCRYTTDIHSADIKVPSSTLC